MLAVAFIGAALLHTHVPRDAVGAAPVTAPSAALLSAGRPSVAATFAWGSTVLHYANAHADAPAIVRGIETTHRFDPQRQAALSHGSLMVRRAHGDPVPVLELGLAEFPDEPWFPWAMGMHHWLDLEDPARAAVWMDRAADLAPEGGYAATAAALRETP